MSTAASVRAPVAADVLVSVQRLVKTFPAKRAGWFRRGAQWVHAVSDVSVDVHRGETLGVVGESGCGKTTLARCLIRLDEPTSGHVVFDGHDITALSDGALRPFRPRMQMVFQDPFGSLNPRRRVGAIIGDPFTIHGVGTSAERRDRVTELMAMVGLNPEHYNRFPAEFSGGQRQRIGIARAIALRPALVVCDEPVSALDVSIRAQVLNLLADLQDRLGLTYLFISHDLSVVRHISDRVAVMYLGKIVELAPVSAIFETPRHPYTRALLAAVPRADPDGPSVTAPLRGDPPSPIDPPAGCRFHPRCPRARSLCAAEEPPLVPHGDDATDHVAACHFPLADGDVDRVEEQAVTP